MSNTGLLFAEACTEANKRMIDELIVRIDSEPQEKLKGKEKRRIRSFLKDLENPPAIITHLNFSKMIKIALVAVFILSLLVVAVMAIEPLREFFITKYDTYSEVIFDVQSDDDYLFATYDCHLERYKLVEDKRSKRYQYQTIRYVNDEGYRLNIYTVPNGATFGYNEENGTVEEVSVNGKHAIGVTLPDALVLIWSSGQFTTRITVDRNEKTVVCIEDLIKIAESRKKIKKGCNIFTSFLHLYCGRYFRQKGGEYV